MPACGRRNRRRSDSGPSHQSGERRERKRAETAGALKAVEDRLAAFQNPTERKAGKEVVKELKQRVEMWMNDESGYRAAEVSAGFDLRTERAKLLELHQRLDQSLFYFVRLASAPAPPFAPT